jgi:hypothetical protein
VALPQGLRDVLEHVVAEREAFQQRRELGLHSAGLGAQQARLATLGRLLASVLIGS